MVECYPRLRFELLNEEVKLLGHVHVFVSGRDLPFLEKKSETILKEDDIISIFPAVGGGKSKRLIRFEGTLRSIPMGLLVMYLEDLGFCTNGNNEVNGPGWRVRIERIEDFVLGSNRVGQVNYSIEGEEQKVTSLLEDLDKKLIRVGA